ncbi:MAG: EamA family transporter [Nocardioides sp.]|nr:EamA family transporter [Nocardioides sp.]
MSLEPSLVPGPSSTHHHPHGRGLVEVAAASVLWGTGGLAVQLIREQTPMSPVTISAWRMTIAAVVLIVALLALRQGDALLDLARSAPRRLLMVGVGTAASRPSGSAARQDPCG